MKHSKTDFNIKLLLCLFILGSLGSLAQSNERAYFLNQTSSASTNSEIKVNSKGDTILVSFFDGQNVQLNTQQRRELKFLGTPYYRNRWFKGTVSLKDGDPSDGIMAFNVVRNSLFFSLENQSKAIEISPARFTLDGLEFHNFQDTYEGANNFYYNIVIDGEPKLLRQYSGKYIKTKAETDYAYGNSKIDEYEGKYIKDVAYYFVIQKQLVLVKRKRSFFNSMGPYRKKGKQLVKENNLNLKRTRDIVQLAKLLKQ